MPVYNWVKWDPHKGDRMGKAWDAVIMLLEDGEWHAWPELMSVGTYAGGVVTRTVSNLLFEGLEIGYLRQKGTSRRKSIKLTHVGRARWLEGVTSMVPPNTDE